MNLHWWDPNRENEALGLMRWLLHWDGEVFDYVLGVRWVWP